LIAIPVSGPTSSACQQLQRACAGRALADRRQLADPRREPADLLRRICRWMTKPDRFFSPPGRPAAGISPPGGSRSLRKLSVFLPHLQKNSPRIRPDHTMYADIFGFDPRKSAESASSAFYS